MMQNSLTDNISAYSAWRSDLAEAIRDYRNWLVQQDISDTQIDLRIQHLLDRLRDDKLNVAFVAEFSRGKSELINAIFFADYGQRLLPSGAGRTTMCPTELLYDETKPVSLQLLPIETRATDTTTVEYKRYAEEWSVIPLDTNDSKSMLAAFEEISRTRSASLEEAEHFGLYDPDNPEDACNLNPDNTIDIPIWRYAIINIPHPLLQQGLVVLDTPGLNAIGTEPELTLNMLPNAHAVLFILAADIGVTKTEIDVWRNYISSNHWQQKGRMAVMNKIDSLWDELKSDSEIEHEINKQRETCSELLGMSFDQTFPVSAYMGLLGKVSNDQAMLEKSRLLELEMALSNDLIPSKKEIVRDNTESEIEDLIKSTNILLKARLQGVTEQLEDLRNLRGKNDSVIDHMMHKIKNDKDNFEKSLKRFQALQSIFSKQASRLFVHLGMESIRIEVTKTREAMIKSNFTKGIREAMDAFFVKLKSRLKRADKQISEIKRMTSGMHSKFSEDHGMRQVIPPSFSTMRYQKELAKLEQVYRKHYDTAHMLTHEKITLTSRFFETLASRVINTYEVANRDVESWLNKVILPMELQVQEHQIQLNRRLDSVKRIYKATDSLERRIEELDVMEAAVHNQMQEIMLLRQNIIDVLEIDHPLKNAEAA